MEKIAEVRKIPLAKAMELIKISALTSVSSLPLPSKLAGYAAWEAYALSCCEKQKKAAPKYEFKDGVLVIGSSSSDQLTIGADYDDAGDPTQLLLVYKAREKACQNLLAIIKQPNANLETALAYQLLTLINRGTPAGLTLYIQQMLLATYSLAQVTQSSLKVEQESLSKDAIYVRRCFNSVLKRLENDKTSTETANVLIAFLETVQKKQKTIISFAAIKSSLELLLSQSTNPAKA